MSKELEALEIIKNAPTIYVGCASDIYTRYSHECKIIENALKDYELLKSNQIFIERAKKLKALKIIKEHPEQLLDIIDTENYNEYLDLDYAPNQYISEENYYLLKEVIL